MLTQEEVKKYLDYNSDTGISRWKIIKNYHSKIGEIAGGKSSIHGYWRIGLNRKSYKAHRLAWLYIYGKFPNNEIDHINRVRDDNRICNLRDVTKSINMRNFPIKKNNTSNCTGVSYRKTGRGLKRWRAYININKKRIDLGDYLYKEDAIKARKEAELKYNFLEL